MTSLPIVLTGALLVALLMLVLWLIQRKHGDGRYRRMRAECGATAQTFFLAAGAAPRAPGATDMLAVGLWLIGMVGVSVADRQLARFRSDPGNRGRTCRHGLWRASRHPNYFFEWILWCGFGLLAWPAVWGWLGMASPAILLFLILFVTGVPPTEAQALASRGADYRDYQRTTSPFIPWFRKGRSA